MWAFILISLTLLLFLMPFAPAFSELRHIKKYAPLDINPHDGNWLDHQITLFRDLVKDKPLIKNKTRSAQQTLEHEDSVSDGVSGRTQISVPYDLETLKNQPVALIEGDLELPSGFSAENKLYVKKQLTTGMNNHLASLLVEENVILNSGTQINQFIYCGANLIIYPQCTLLGYAKAHDHIIFLGPAEFQCLYGKNIVFNQNFKNLDELLKTDSSHETAQNNNAHDKQAFKVELTAEPELNVVKSFAVIDKDSSRKIINTDLIIDEHNEIKQNLIVKGNLTIKSHCHIDANIKCYGDITIAEHCTLSGTLFGEKNIYIHGYCHLQGPIVTQDTLQIGAHCSIGSPDKLTSVIAAHIKINDQTQVSGLLFAKVSGKFII